MTLPYPPDYQPQPRRSDEEIIAELNRRSGHTSKDAVSIDLSKASPAPEPVNEGPARFTLATRKKAPRPGHIGGCGRNSKAKK